MFVSRWTTEVVNIRRWTTLDSTRSVTQWLLLAYYVSLRCAAIIDLLVTRRAIVRLSSTCVWLRTESRRLLQSRARFAEAQVLFPQLWVIVESTDQRIRSKVGGEKNGLKCTDLNWFSIYFWGDSPKPRRGDQYKRLFAMKML